MARKIVEIQNSELDLAVLDCYVDKSPNINIDRISLERLQGLLMNFYDIRATQDEILQSLDRLSLVIELYRFI